VTPMRRPPWDAERMQYRRPGKNPWTPAEWRLLERMRFAGRSSGEIAKRLGRSENAVDVAWSRYGPSPEYKRIQAYLVLVRKIIAKSLDIVNEDPEALKAIKISKRGRRKHGRNKPNEVFV
jgi:hypothetical protein